MSPNTRVTLSVPCTRGDGPAAGYVRRSRQCDHCGKAFCIYEVRAVKALVRVLP